LTDEAAITEFPVNLFSCQVLLKIYLIDNQ